MFQEKNTISKKIKVLEVMSIGRCALQYFNIYSLWLTKIISDNNFPSGDVWNRHNITRASRSLPLSGEYWSLPKHIVHVTCSCTYVYLMIGYVICPNYIISFSHCASAVWMNIRHDGIVVWWLVPHDVIVCVSMFFFISSVFPLL